MDLKDFKWTWRGVGLLSIAATLVLLIGFVYAAKDIMYPQGASSASESPGGTAAPSGAADVLRVAAIGDSLAKGTGDETGEGFVRRAVTGLSSDGTKAELVGNLGINGLTTTGLRDKLNEQGVQYVLRQANIIIVSIGGNDLFQGARTLLDASAGGMSAGSGGASPETGTTGTPGAGNSTPGAGSGGAGSGSTTGGADSPGLDTESGTDNGSDSGGGMPERDALQNLDPEQLLANLPAASGRLEDILNTVSKINPDARIYYIGLYNPFGDIREMLVPGNQAVTFWNNAVMDIINRNTDMTLVPVLDLFNGHLGNYLSSDHFHPNGDGYQRMADRIVQAVR